MKKIISIALSLALVLLIIPFAIGAEASTLTVGASGDYATIAEAITAAADGDTIQLVDNITETNVTISKPVTIDTYGFVWTGGTGSKQNCATIKANVTIKNSQRTTPVTADSTPDIVANSVKNQGVFVVGSSKITVNFENVVIKSTNAYTNNQGCAVQAYDTTFTMNLKNCYFSSIHFAELVMNKCALTLTAEDSIFDGPCGSYVTVGTDKGSSLYFKNCEFGSVVGHSDGASSTSATGGTTAIPTRVITFEGCTGNGIYGSDSTAKFVGTNAFTNVYAGVKVTCADGDAIYSDAEYVNQLVSGTTLTENCAIYSKTLPTEFDIYIDGVKVQTVPVGESVTLPTSVDNGFIAYTDGTSYYAENQVIVPEINLNLTSVSIGDVKMRQGAAMKLNIATGIRFYTQLDTDRLIDLKNSGAVITMGTLIAPTNLLGEDSLTLDTPEENRLSIDYEIGLDQNTWYTQGSFKGMVGSIVNIKDTNVNRRFVGRGYVTVTLGSVTKTVYAEYANDDVINNTRTISYIASALQNDTESADLYAMYKEVVDKYAAKYDKDSEF